MTAVLPEVQQVLDGLARGAVGPQALTIAENRRHAAAFVGLAAPHVPVRRVEDRTITTATGAVPVRLYTPTAAAEGHSAPVTVFVHGGGWVLGDLDSQDHFARVVAERAGSVVVSVGYRLAPEYRFPAPVDDALAVTEWVRSNVHEIGGDPTRVAVFGGERRWKPCRGRSPADRSAWRAPLVVQVLAYPVTDRFDDSPSLRKFVTGPVFSAAQMEWFWGCYLSSPDDGADVRVSPLRAPDLSGLAPAFVVTAEVDPLRDQGIRYVAALRAAGVPVQHRAVVGVPHAFLSFMRDVPIARAILDEIEAFLALTFASMNSK